MVRKVTVLRAVKITLAQIDRQICYTPMFLTFIQEFSNMLLWTLCAFIFLGTSFLSLWVRRDPKIWGTLLGLSLLSGLVAGNMNWIGLIFIIVLLLLWVFYDRRPNVA